MSYYWTSKDEVFRQVCYEFYREYSAKDISEGFLARYVRGEISCMLVNLAQKYIDAIEETYELAGIAWRFEDLSYKDHLTNWLSDPRSCYVKNGQ